MKELYEITGSSKDPKTGRYKYLTFGVHKTYESAQERKNILIDTKPGWIFSVKTIKADWD